MTCRRPTYRTVPHTADAAFEVVSRDRATLFADSVLAFEDLMVGLDAVEAREECLLDVDGVDDGDLLVALLSRALYLFEVQGLVFCEADVTETTAGRVVVRARGEVFDPGRHSVELSVKAVTWHGLACGPCDEGWRAFVTLDL